MTRYKNGNIPAPGQPGSPLTVIDHGTDSNGYWEFQISAHTLWMWMAAKAYAEKHFGKTLHIRTGWNCYRPLAIQAAARQRACAAGNCNAAASPGYSSHGGTWIDSHFTGGVWVNAMAIDVDPNGLTWAQVWEACTAAGFLCNAITIQRAGIAEPWHIIDLHPWDAVPADVNVTDFPNTTTTPPEEEDMFTIYSNGGGGYLIVGAGTFMQLGTALTKATGVDGAATLASFQAAGAKTVVLGQHDWDVVRINILAGIPVPPAPVIPAPTLSDAQLQSLAAAVVAGLPAGTTPPSADAIAKAVNDDTARRLQS